MSRSGLRNAGKRISFPFETPEECSRALLFDKVREIELEVESLGGEKLLEEFRESHDTMFRKLNLEELERPPFAAGCPPGTAILDRIPCRP